jgi:glutamate racemase
MKTRILKDEAHNVYPAHNKFIFQDYRRGDPRNHVQEQGQGQIEQLAQAPIGVFDSGAGGLTILTSLRQELPNENYIYFGDTANCPYGIRSEEEVANLAINASRFLLDQGVKIIVVACNTASQAALNILRATYTLPFVGVVPAIKPATRITKKGKIGIAATNQTVKATYLRHLIDDFASDIQVYAVGCPELVTLVERGELNGEIVEQTLRLAFAPLLEKEVDVIVLGCTHFPVLRPAIQRVVGKKVQVIDSGAAIARRTHGILDAEGLLRPRKAEGGKTQIWCSGDARDFSRVASAVLGYSVIVSQATH